MIDYEAYEAFLGNGKFVYSDNDFNSFFFNTLADLGKQTLEVTLEKNLNNKELPGHTYSINKLGYRSKDFDFAADVLTSGCSHTWGIGIPDLQIWPEMLAKNLNMSFANTALPGRSVAQIIKSIFAYFKEVGNPKIVCILFPDLYRYAVPVTKNYLEPYTPNSNGIIYNTNSFAKSSKIYDRPKYMKAPYFIEDVVTEEMAIWSNLFYIEALEQYCKSNGIVLYYSFWESDSDSLIKKAFSVNSNFYTGYLDFKNKNWYPKLEKGQPQKYLVDGKDLNCHADLKNSLNEEYWDRAGDRFVNEVPHIGTHRHIHIAEEFQKNIEMGKDANSRN